MKNALKYKERNVIFIITFISIFIAVLSVYFPNVSLALAFLLILHIILIYRPAWIVYGIIIGYPISYVLISPAFEYATQYASLPIILFDFLIIYTSLIFPIPYFIKNKFVINNKSILIIIKCSLLVFSYFLVSILWSDNIQLGLLYYRRMLIAFLMLLLTVYFYKNKKFKDNIFTVIKLSLLIQSIVCIFQYSNGTLMYGTFYHDANLTMYILFFIILALWKMLFDQHRSLSTVIIVILSLFPFIFAQQRTAWIALIIALSPFFIKSKKMILLSIGMAICVFIFFRSEITQRFLLLQNVGTGGNYDTANSAGWRLNIWNEMFAAAKENPMLGEGLGSSNSFVGSVYSGVAFLPHNEYLRIFYESGILGISLFVIFLLSPLFFHKLYLKDNEKGKYALLYISITIAYLACMAPDNIVTLADVSTFYFTIVGITIASVLNKESSHGGK